MTEQEQCLRVQPLVYAADAALGLFLESRIIKSAEEETGGGVLPVRMDGE